jgi:carbon-monoxide dehydrogenase large subunit
MAKFGMGQPVKRLEDHKFITGAGRYTDDIELSNASHGFVLRSPHAHARITSISTDAALKAPGVILILTAEDIKSADYGSLPCMIDLKNRDGSAMTKPERPILADGFVRHVGDPIAFIVAETIEAARDAAEQIEIDYEILPAIADTEGALSSNAAQVWPEAKRNLCFDWGLGDFDQAERLRKSAARVIELKIINNRVIPNAIEPRNALGQFENGRYTLTVSSQGSHTIQGLLAEKVMKISKDELRVITPDVGGGFGTKIFIYPELPLVLLAAKKAGRPVRWIGERSDSFLSDAHGRDHVTTARLSLTKDNRFLGLEVDMIANLGAYLSHYGPFIPTMAGAQMYVGVYKWDAVAVHVKGVFTHTTPVDAYRGAGRPEAAYLVERLIDHAAAEIGISPAELRRINFVAPTDMPYQTMLGHVYDSGDFAKNMDDALALADVSNLPARKAAAKAKGKLRGLGLATYIESCGGGGDETAWIDVGADGKVVLMVGSQNNGQGHWTSYAQLVSDKLGIDIHDVTLIQGDTDVVPTGRGTGGSRAIPVGGAATVAATDRVIEKGKRFAAHYLETAEADIEFADATFTVAGTDKRMSLIEVAKRAADSPPPGEDAGLKATDSFKPPAATFPNGCHVCEVEIDAMTGVIEIPGYWVVDDFGTILNPLMLAGQVHGGVAQGLGQALMELARYDDAGQLLTGSFMDYTMPRADDLPHINFKTNVFPCTTNPLGVKGAGEAGAIGAPPAIVNAVVDAVREYGIKHLDMPITAEKIWRALADARMPMAAD